MTANDEIGGSSLFGRSVALSDDRSTALIGGPYDNSEVGRRGCLPDRRSAQVKAALVKALAISGRAAKIAQLLKHGGYTVSFTALSAGHLVIGWYFVPKGAHLTKATKPTLVATAIVTVRRAGKTAVKIALTGKGRQLLKHSKRLKPTAKGSFTPPSAATTSTTKTITLTR